MPAPILILMLNLEFDAKGQGLGEGGTFGLKNPDSMTWGHCIHIYIYIYIYISVCI